MKLRISMVFNLLVIHKKLGQTPLMYPHMRLSLMKYQLRTSVEFQQEKFTAFIVFSINE